uniref:Protein MMS22-like n=1 Tax=Denticeps clupeoides TaxID=299321 RepID=A0AAY4AHK6_9TELE
REMEDDFGQSLTPPVSPFAGESHCDPASARQPCFSCAWEPGRDESGKLWKEMLISIPHVRRLLLKLDPAPGDFETDSVDIFGFPWVTETALVESTRLLFGLFRQKVLRLETLVQSSSHDFASSLHPEADDIRNECVLFLQYVKVFICRFLEPPRAMDESPSHPYEDLEAQLPSALVEELFGVTLLVGRLKDLPASVQSALTIHHQGKLFPPSWHLLHLHLDIHWSVLEILHLLGQKMLGQVVYAHEFMNLSGENLTSISLFEEHLNALFCDLISLAMNKYSKVRPTEAISSHHYHCLCTKELWILLIHLSEYRSKVMHTQSFWGYVNPLLQDLVKGEAPGKQQLPTTCKDPVGFTWWLVTHLAELGQYNRSGALQSENQLEDNWSFIGELLKKSCGATNTPFTIPWLGVTGLGSVSRSPLSLLDLAQSCCSPAPLSSAEHTQLYRSTNSFHIFLHVLALHLSQENAGGAPWRQIKGRVYSKFHQRRMAELSEAGLMNFLLLFLVLARRAELEDVTARACDLLSLRLATPTAPPQRALVWRGQLGLLLLHLERGLDVGPLAARLAAWFSEVAREFYLKTTEPSRKLALWLPLGAYLEGLAEVFEMSSFLSQSEEKLLNEGFGLLLPACGQSELSSALGVLQTALCQLHVAKERHLAVASALWAHFYPFLRSLRLSQTPPAQLADAAAGFTRLALDMPSSAPRDLQPHPVQSIMQCFGWDEMLHPLHATRFLGHVLQNGSECGATRRTGVTSAEGLCVRTWLRCVLQQHLHKNNDGSDSRAGKKTTLDEQLVELTRLVLRLPDVESVLQKAGLLASAVPTEPRPALAMFIKAVGRVYSGLQVLSERSAMVTQALEYVGDILKYIKPYLLNKNQEGLHLAYWAVGYLVKHWSAMLATLKAQQLLFRIVDSLLLPRLLLQQDPPAQVLLALKESLPLYLQGLSVSAGVSQSQGPYLKQQLRSVISQYLGRFLPATASISVIANHPVLLAACEVVPILDCVHSENFLQFKGPSPPPRLAAFLAFLLEILKRNRDTDPALLTVPLPSVLRCLMLVSEPQVKRWSTEALQLIVERSIASYYYGSERENVCFCRTFVEENEGVYDQQVYSVLEMVSGLDRASVQVLVPVLSVNLRNNEQKRGLGKNTTLRYCIHQAKIHILNSYPVDAQRSFLKDWLYTAPSAYTLHTELPGSSAVSLILCLAPTVCVCDRNAYKKLLSQLGECGQAEMVSLNAE